MPNSHLIWVYTVCRAPFCGIDSRYYQILVQLSFSCIPDKVFRKFQPFWIFPFYTRWCKTTSCLMSNSYPHNRIVNPHLTTIKDSYTPTCKVQVLSQGQYQKNRYRKIPKYSDTLKTAVIILKFGSTIEKCVQRMKTEWQTVKTLIRLTSRSSLIWVYTVCLDLHVQ